MTTKTEEQIHADVVALIGDEAARKLYDAGYSVVDGEQVAAFIEEHEKSNARLRETAAAAMRHAGATTVRAEIAVVNGMVTVITTHPAGDEHRMAKEIGKTLAFFLRGQRGPKDGPVREDDDIEHERMRDTNNVPFVATPPASGEGA